MFGLDSLLVAVLGGLTRGIVGRAREMLRDRSAHRQFAQRQEYLATLRQQEAKLQSEQRRAERQVQNLLAERQTRRDHEREVELVKFRAMASLESQRAAVRDQRMLEKSPFPYDRDQVRQLLDQKLHSGRPVLLMAPFYNDGQSGPASQFDVALRRTWESMPWADNLASLAGLFGRPLHQADVDLMLIRDALESRPAVLIHGDIQAGRRVWTSLLGFGLISGAPDDVLKVNLPKLTLPDPTSSGDEVLAFQDELAELCGTVAGVFGDWYHLFHAGRAPQVHLQCEDEALRRSLGAALAGAYDVAAAGGQLGWLEAGLGQARVLAESGLGNAAMAVARSLPPAKIAQSTELSRDLAAIEDLTSHDLRLPGTTSGQRRVPDASTTPAPPPARHAVPASAPQAVDAVADDRVRAERAADFWVQ